MIHSEKEFIFGMHPVMEAIKGGRQIDRVLVRQGLRGGQYHELMQVVNEFAVPWQVVPQEKLDYITRKNHQGVIAWLSAIEFQNIEIIVPRIFEDGGEPLLLMLDGVSDVRNFGAIVRSAEVVGAAGVIIANKRAAGVTVGSYKTSAGAVMHLPIAQVPNIARALDDLKAAGFWVGGASEHAEGSCWDAPFEGRVALVMGSEGDGISRLVLEKCDFLTKLPQRGMTESLNVAQATTALCFEWLRRNAGELMGEE